MNRKPLPRLSTVASARVEIARGEDDGAMVEIRARHARMLAELDEIGRKLAEAAGRAVPAGRLTAAHTASAVSEFGYSPENTKLYRVLRLEMESRIQQRRLLLGPAASSLIH